MARANTCLIKSEISIFVGGENKSFLLIVAIYEVELMRVRSVYCTHTHTHNTKRENTKLMGRTRKKKAARAIIPLITL